MKNKRDEKNCVWEKESPQNGWQSFKMIKDCFFLKDVLKECKRYHRQLFAKTSATKIKKKSI
jgi:hypothetical protein